MTATHSPTDEVRVAAVHRFLRSWPVLVLPLLAGGASVLGAQALPTPRELAARHDSLIGGRAALDAHTSLRMIGSFTLPLAGIDAPFEILKVKPDQYLFRASLGPIGDLMSGYDGEHAWAIRPGQGATLLSGPEAAQLAEQANFFGDLHDLTKFSSVETVDVADFEGRPVYRVRMVRPGGEAVMEYFDVASGLSAGGMTSVELPTGRLETISVIGDYKEFGGVRVATRMVQRNSQFEMILIIVAVEFDTIGDAAVDPPESVRILIKP
jgi:hypothetical protein